MSSNQGLILGNEMGFVDKRVIFSPDSPATQNPHLMIIGATGSGKTYMLRKILQYLDDANKIVHVIDMHGDLFTPGEKKFEFTLRNSEYSIHPFDFDKDEKNGGPAAHVDTMVKMFKACFIPGMGPVQEYLLKKLFMGVYHIAGIHENNPSTWNNELPEIETLYDLYEHIYSALNNGIYISVKKYFGQIQKIHNKILEQRAITTDQNTRGEGISYTKVHVESLADNNQEELEQLEEDLNEGSDEDCEGYGVSPALIKRLNSKFIDLNAKISRYLTHCKTGKFQEEFDRSFKGVEYDEFDTPQKLKGLESLQPYLETFTSSSLFGNKQFNYKRGINRYDISGFTNTGTPTLALYFTNIMIERIFRKNKIKGEYLGPDNEKVHTYIVLDESKIVLPTGQEKENPLNIFNRTVTEIRKYGVGIIIVSQRVKHFNDEILSSMFTKIILRSDNNDIPDIKKRFGIKNEENLGLISKQGTAIVCQGHVQKLVQLH